MGRKGGIEGIPYRGVEVKSLGRDRERVREQLMNMNISANLKPNLQIKLSVQLTGLYKVYS
jgi:hypothetical protein